jgi:biopolymer transport protein ExbD/biopolymer transport protein TolR
MAIEISSGGRKKGAKPEMNVTPLVDVVLVLLIVFMVVTPMLTKQFWIHLPAEPRDEVESRPPVEREGPIVVTVESNGSIRILRDVVQLRDFSARLRGILSSRANEPVFFDAEDDAPYGRAVEVLDQIRGAGARTIAVSTESLASLSDSR